MLKPESPRHDPTSAHTAVTGSVIEPRRNAVTLHPRRVPAPIRWHRTKVSAWQSWRLYIQLIPHFRRHTVFEYLTALPGQDDVIVARLPFVRYVIVRSPELARHVLVSNQSNYRKSAEYDMLAVATGRGPVTDLNEASWERKRRLVQPIFAKRKIEAFDRDMAAAAEDAVNRMLRKDLSPSGTAEPVVNMAVEMNRLTADVIARTIFGTTLSGPMAQVRLDRLLKLFGVGVVLSISRPLRRCATWLATHLAGSGDPTNTRISINVLRIISWVVAPHVMRDLRHTERVVDQLINEYRCGQIQNNNSLLAALIDARDPDTGDTYSDREIHDELMGFLTAGMETTATALTWLWQLLADHPNVRERLHAELDEVLSGSPPTAADIDRLPWTSAVVAETMRLYPPIIALAREAKDRDVLGNVPIDRGTTVAVLMHGLHNNRRIWGDGYEKFDPTRHLAESADKAQRKANIPFGAGKRICVASGYASMEAVILIATIAQHVTFEPASNTPTLRQNSFTGGPVGPVPMRAIPRDTSIATSKVDV